MRAASLIVAVGALACAGALVVALRGRGPITETYGGAWGDGSIAGGNWGDYMDTPASDTAPLDTVTEGDVTGSAVDSVLDWTYSAMSLFGNTMRTSINGIDRIKEHEALRLTKYLDQAGKWTIGYGHLIRAFESFPGPITEEKALGLLVADLAAAESAVNANVKVAITQEQFDALVSLAFNIGSGNFRGSSVVRRLNAGDAIGAAAAFALWNKIEQGGQLVVSQGLVNRRAAEAQLFSQGVIT